MFYGISVDDKLNVWVIDVGLYQVRDIYIDIFCEFKNILKMIFGNNYFVYLNKFIIYDVQVMRFLLNSDQVDLVFGQRFQLGKGDNLFCKFIDVEVLLMGEFFISDG